MKPRKFALVKYNHDPNPYEGMSFCYLGDIPNMPGHSIVLTLEYDNKPLIFHTENLIELTTDET